MLRPLGCQALLRWFPAWSPPTAASGGQRPVGDEGRAFGTVETSLLFRGPWYGAAPTTSATRTAVVLVNLPDLFMEGRPISSTPCGWIQRRRQASAFSAFTACAPFATARSHSASSRDRCVPGPEAKAMRSRQAEERYGRRCASAGLVGLHQRSRKNAATVRRNRGDLLVIAEDDELAQVHRTNRRQPSAPPRQAQTTANSNWM